MKKGMLFPITIFFLGLALLAGIYSFVVIPNIKQQEKEKYALALARETQAAVPVLVYTGEKPLLEGTVLTDLLETEFSVLYYPPGTIRGTMATEYSSVAGMQIKYTLAQGQPVSLDLIQPAVFAQPEDGRLKEFLVSSLVGGHVTVGAYVDVLLRYPDGSYDVVVPHTQIYDILPSPDGSKGFQPEREDYSVVFSVNEEAYRDLLLAQQLGRLDLRLYQKTDQTPSEKTFLSGYKPQSEQYREEVGA